MLLWGTSRAPRLISDETLRKERQRWKSRWAEFDQDDTAVENFEDIPWPPATSNSLNTFAMDNGMTQEEQKYYLRKM